MGSVNTGNFAKLIWPGVKGWYGQTYDEWKAEHPMLFDKVSSDKAYEEYVGFSGTGLFQRKDESAGIMFDSMQQGFVTRATNVVYALGIIITYEMYKNDQYGLMSKRAKFLAFSARQTKEIIGANVYNNAFDTAFTYGDGQPLLSTTRPNKSGGTWSNRIAVAADLSELSLEQASIDIDDFRNDRGLRVSVSANKLIVPKNLKFDAARILKSTQQSGTANNDINALREMNIFPGGVFASHYLDDPKAWFIRTNIPSGEGMIYQEREPDSFDMDNDSDTRNAKYMGYGWYTFTMADARAIYGSPGL